MAVKVKFSAALKAQTNESETSIEAAGAVSSVLDALVQKYGPEFRKRIFDDAGNLKKFIAVYVNGEDIRFSQGVKTPVKSGDEVLILPAVSGG